MRIALVLVMVNLAMGAGPATLPVAAPEGLDAALWARMTKVDQKAGAIVDLVADFEQQKFTPLLKKPMVSAGTVRAKGSAMLWDTRTPAATVMRVDEKEVSLFYPSEKTLEIYPLAGNLGAMASSPLPRLAMLIEHFKFAPASGREMGAADDAAHLALRLDARGRGDSGARRSRYGVDRRRAWIHPGV